MPGSVVRSDDNRSRPSRKAARARARYKMRGSDRNTIIGFLDLCIRINQKLLACQEIVSRFVLKIDAFHDP